MVIVADKRKMDRRWWPVPWSQSAVSIASISVNSDLKPTAQSMSLDCGQADVNPLGEPFSRLWASLPSPWPQPYAQDTATCRPEEIIIVGEPTRM